MIIERHTKVSNMEKTKIEYIEGDVVADVREGSPTYGNWYGVWLALFKMECIIQQER